MKKLSQIKNPKIFKEEDFEREKRIISSLNLDKLPFKISKSKLCDLNLAMVRHSKSVLKYADDKPNLQWCFSSIKRLKVFLLIFEANELGVEIYKEKISGQMPEYSYKTIAQVIDEGVAKKLFLKLPARIVGSKDLKIRNLRPSEDLIIQFVNWKIDLLSSVMQFKNII